VGWVSRVTVKFCLLGCGRRLVVEEGGWEVGALWGGCQGKGAKAGVSGMVSLEPE